MLRPVPRHRRPLAAALGAALVGAMALAGCSADDTGPDIDSASSGAGPLSSPASASTSASASPTQQVVDGVPLTAQGSTLTVGQPATVSYQPRQGQTAVLDVTVTRLEKTSFKKSFVGWDIPAAQQSAQPYFVRATVVNRGTLDLGRRPVPLYIVDGTNTLVEATTFASAFKPCSPGHFPSSFPTGASADVCLVYLAPNAGTLTAVSFRPTQKSDPITWTGTLQKPEKQTKGKGGKNGGQGGGGQDSASATATATATASPSS